MPPFVSHPFQKFDANPILYIRSRFVPINLRFFAMAVSASISTTSSVLSQIDISFTSNPLILGALGCTKKCTCLAEVNRCLRCVA